MKAKIITLPILAAVVLTLATCTSAEIFGTYKLNADRSNSILTLYKDSSFVEKTLSNSRNRKCKGIWQPINMKDSIIETTTLS